MIILSSGLYSLDVALYALQVILVAHKLGNIERPLVLLCFLAPSITIV
jgi:hypothetical protein